MHMVVEGQLEWEGGEGGGWTPDLPHDGAGVAHAVQQEPAGGFGALARFAIWEGQGDAVWVHDRPLRGALIDDGAARRLEALLDCVDELVWAHPQVQDVCGPNVLPALH